MPAAIPNNIRKIILQQWLEGFSREKISSRNQISEGAVSNIVEGWRIKLFNYEIDALRDLVLSLKHLNLTPERCAIGFRTAMMMQKIGVTEELFNHFFIDIYKRCELLNISPDDISNYLEEIISLSHNISPSRIPEYLASKKNKIEATKKEEDYRNQLLLELENKITQAHNNLEDILSKENLTLQTIEWQNNLKSELSRERIPVDDIQLFVQCIKGIKKKNFDPNEIVIQYSDYDGFKKMIEFLANAKEQKEKELKNLESQLTFLNDELNKNRLKIYNIRELDSIGFGLQELKILNSTLKEIALENDQNDEDVVKKFFNDLTYYEKITRFSTLLKSLEKEYNILIQKITTSREIISANQFLGPVLQNLLTKNVTERDIVDIYSLFSLVSSEYSSEMSFDKQALLQDIERYKTMKQCLSRLEEQKRDLEKEIFLIKKEKENLDKYMTFYTSFLFGSDSDKKP